MPPRPRLVSKPEKKVLSRAGNWIFRSAAAALMFFCLGKPCPAQQYTAVQHEQAEAMLRDVTDDVKKHYFDPLALGSDWNSKVLET